MDSATHLVMGIGLAGLAQLDPAVAASPAATGAVMTATVIGSLAPDTDTVLRLRSNHVYVRHHRGLSHALPFLALWTGVAAATAWLCFGFEALAWHIVLAWSLLAVGLHVFVDLFNAYGTQALRPFHQRWIAWHIMPIFDPVIFTAHVLALLAWLVGVDSPGIWFAAVYGFLVLYYAIRVMTYFTLKNKLRHHDSANRYDCRYQLVPTVYLWRWHIVKCSADGRFHCGEWRFGKLHWTELLTPAHGSAVAATATIPEVVTFRELVGPYACPLCESSADGYEIQWIDVRNRHRKQYPFVAVIRLDQTLAVMETYIGWINETRLERKWNTEMTWRSME